MVDDASRTVWDWLREYAATQAGPFESQEVLTWFRRHVPSKANERTVRTHLRGACWNVGDRSQFSHKEPFLTRIDRGIFRRATPDEIEQWHGQNIQGPAVVAQHHRRGAGVSSGRRNPARTERDAAPEAATRDGERSEEWHTEANVQASLVTALAGDGWRIHSVANTATKEHGIDVIASRDDQTVGIEVKGFPSRGYADPARAHEVKRTSPSTQAGHWYSQAVLAAMRLRSREPEWRSVIALPDFPRYRDLHAETVGSLTSAQIEVWWLDQTGLLRRP